MTKPRILSMGCGGIGGILAAKLIECDHDLLAVTHNPAIANAINARGFILRDEHGQQTVAGHTTPTIPATAGQFDFIFLVTQPPQVEEAARAALPYLAPDGAMVCFQNGLCEQRIAAIAGAHRTIGAIVAWGGSMLEPGVYERTSEGGFVIGRLEGAQDPRLDVLRTVLEPAGSVDVTANLRGARWSKLAINCAISALGTIGGDRLGALIRYRFVRRLALEVMTEAVAVARARGVRLEKIAGTVDPDWVALTESERAVSGSATLLAKHALLLAVGAKFRRLRSSMLIAIERGREPAVDFLNGEVVWRGQRLSIPTPLNARIVETIHKIAAGRLRSGVPLLRHLYAETRDPVGPPAQPPADGPRLAAGAPP